MKKRALALATAFALTASSAFAGGFSVSSPDLKAGAPIGDKFIFSGFGCTGANVSPGLTWKNAPKGTKSFAVTSYDPDAPTGSGWWHWLAYNIPVTADSLPTGAGSTDAAQLPAGTVQSRTDFGAPGYGGPCPPQGDKPHRYIFTVFALKVDALPVVDANSPAAMVGYFLNANTLAKASLTAKYGRK
jgi:hypothetical protein